MISHRATHFIVLGTYVAFTAVRLGNFLLGAADATIDDFCNILIVSEGVGDTDLSTLELIGSSTPEDGAPEYIERVVPTNIQAGPDEVCIKVDKDYSIEHDGLVRYELKTPEIAGLHLNGITDESLRGGVRAEFRKHGEPKTDAGLSGLCAAGIVTAVVAGGLYFAHRLRR